MLNSLSYSMHALQRMAQRGLSEDDINFVGNYGKSFRRAGVVFIYLGDKHIPQNAKKRHQRLGGTTIILDAESCSRVVTVYRNRRSSIEDRKKKKFDNRK